MFKKFAYVACAMSILTFGSEAVYRFRSENKSTDDESYIVQSNMVLATSAMILIMAANIIKLFDIVTVKAMRLVALVTIGLLFLSIALRSKYHFFMPIQEQPIYNLYNATSFFVCIQIVCWFPFFIHRNAIPVEQMPSLPLTEEIRRRRARYEEDFDRRNNERNMSAIRSDDINYHSREGETLPSYYELPSPPVYTKVDIPENINSNSNEPSQQEEQQISVPNVDHNNASRPTASEAVVQEMTSINRVDHTFVNMITNNIIQEEEEHHSSAENLSTDTSATTPDNNSASVSPPPSNSNSDNIA